MGKIKVTSTVGQYMLFPDSISTKDLSKLLDIKTASALSIEHKGYALNEWAKTFWASKIKKQQRHKLYDKKIYCWM